MSEEDYVKWLRGRKSECDLTPDVIEEEGEIKDNFKENVKPESRGLDDELVLLMSRKRHKKPKHNLKFLTVEDTQYKGSFSGKFREDHDIPKPFNEAKAPDYKSHSALGMRTSSGNKILKDLLNWFSFQMGSNSKKIKVLKSQIELDLRLIDFWCLMPLSVVLQLYHGDQF